MKFALKLTFWISVMLLFTCASILFRRFSENSTISTLKQSISKLDSSSKSIFFLGSSRIQRSVNSTLIEDSLRDWQVYNLGLLGNTLAQNIFLAHYIKSLPGNKVVFIEFTYYLSSYPETFEKAMEYLELPNFPNSYVEFLGKPLTPTKNYSFLEDLEIAFWKAMIQNQNAIKRIVFQDDFNGYHEIGYSPTNRNDVVSKESFLSLEKWQEFAQSKLDTNLFEKANQILKSQKQKEFNVVFLLPVTANDQVDFEGKIPAFNHLPKDSKWEYKEQFLKEIANPAHLENKNHMNSLGAFVYSQGLVNYIKANEKNWQ